MRTVAPDEGSGVSGKVQLFQRCYTLPPYTVRTPVRSSGVHSSKNQYEAMSHSATYTALEGKNTHRTTSNRRVRMWVGQSRTFVRPRHCCGVNRIGFTTQEVPNCTAQAPGGSCRGGPPNDQTPPSGFHPLHSNGQRGRGEHQWLRNVVLRRTHEVKSWK